MYKQILTGLFDDSNPYGFGFVVTEGQEKNRPTGPDTAQLDLQGEKNGYVKWV